jgi:hypothetical protein
LGPGRGCLPRLQGLPGLAEKERTQAEDIDYYIFGKHLTGCDSMKTRKKLLSGARGLWLRKPETKVKESAKIYKRKGVAAKKKSPTRDFRFSLVNYLICQNKLTRLLGFKPINRIFKGKLLYF